MYFQKKEVTLGPIYWYFIKKTLNFVQDLLMKRDIHFF